LNEVDSDGDGDPHTQRTVDLVPRDQVVLPELDELAAAMHHCAKTTCRAPSSRLEFRFTFKPGGGGLRLSRLELIEHPPCPTP
jgi:hypothetical protein